MGPIRAKQSWKGQGVVEYAGALVVASIIVAGVLAVGPSGFGQVFTAIWAAVGNFISDGLPD